MRMYLPVLCLTLVLFLGIHGDRLDTLDITMKALVSYIQTDLLLLRENISDNREQMSKLADLVNTSMTTLTLQLNTAPTDVKSTKVTPKTDTDHMPDFKQDIMQLKSDVKRITRATYDEKRYGRQVYVQLKDAIIDLQTNMQSLLENQLNQETKINELFKHIENRVNISSFELTEMQVKMKDTIIENQVNLTSETEDKLKRDNDKLVVSLNELKTKIYEMQSEVGVNQTHSYGKLSQLHADLITDMNVKFADLSQTLSKNMKMLNGTKTQCFENRNQITSAESSIGTQLNEMKTELIKVLHPTLVYSHDRTTRLANVNYLGDVRIGGRLEVYHDGEWGTVCDDNMVDTAAKVACKEFGYANGKVNKYAFYGQGREQKIWLDDVRCDGNEFKIQDCSHAEWGIANCNHAEDVGVTCY